MKNKELLPNEVVPSEIRLEVYKEMLEIIKKGKKKWVESLDSFSLCIYLPAILWNLDHFNDRSPSGRAWYFNDTRNMFPELERFLTKGYFSDYTDKERINFLEKSINTLSKTI